MSSVDGLSPPDGGRGSVTQVSKNSSVILMINKRDL
jgi:hypothetical protein